MKAIRLLVLFSLLLLVNNARSQDRGEINLADSTGLPGDNFSLQGALGLFKESKSLADFEKKLNTKDNVVNNLDLNSDGKTDFVKVVDVSKEDAHAIILLVPVTKTENQDVAVIEIEKNGEASAIVQIVGDEALYPENTIVEPAEKTEPDDAGNSKRGPSLYSIGSPYVYVNVWGWPCVNFLFAPAYVGWVSPWYWGYYPAWWSPWPVYPWRWHYMSCYHYHHYYHHTVYHHTTYAHQVYAPRRSYSGEVSERYRDNHERYKATASSRPRPGTVQQGRPYQSAGSVSRPTVKPQSRPIAEPAKQPHSKPAVRPSSQPEKSPQMSQPQSEPTTRPQTKPSTSPGKQPQMKPAPRPQQLSHSRPPAKPAPHSKPMKQSKTPGGNFK